MKWNEKKTVTATMAMAAKHCRMFHLRKTGLLKALMTVPMWRCIKLCGGSFVKRLHRYIVPFKWTSNRIYWNLFNSNLFRQFEYIYIYSHIMMWAEKIVKSLVLLITSAFLEIIFIGCLTAWHWMARMHAESWLWAVFHFSLHHHERIFPVIGVLYELLGLSFM